MVAKIRHILLNGRLSWCNDRFSFQSAAVVVVKDTPQVKHVMYEHSDSHETVHHQHSPQLYKDDQYNTAAHHFEHLHQHTTSPDLERADHNDKLKLKLQCERVPVRRDVCSQRTPFHCRSPGLQTQLHPTDIP